MKHTTIGKQLLALTCALLLTASLLSPAVTAYAAATVPATPDTAADGAKTGEAKTDAEPEVKTDGAKADAKTDDKKPDDTKTETKPETKPNANKQTAEELRKEYDRLQQEINGKRQEMDSLKTELAQIKNQKATTQQQKNVLDQRNAALQGEINLLEAQIDVTNRSISANETLEQRQTDLFHRQIRMEEEQGTVSYWSVLFKATSFSDLVSRIDFINEIVRYNKQVINDLRRTRQELAQDKAALEQQNEALAASKKELEGQISESMRMLAEYIKTEEGKQAEYDAIKAEEEALDGLIAAAEAKARELGLDEIAGTVGGYAWPCSSIRWITSMFGGRQSPGGIGSTNHKGVDIGTPMGTPVLAAKAGTVTWASWNGGYGNCVIINHGKGNSTLYGHLSGYNVSVGDQVSQGQVIAYSGNTGNSTGPHLHFGIMEGDTWIDPLNYLTGWHYNG